jgi:hypothetical protein
MHRLEEQVQPPPRPKPKSSEPKDWAAEARRHSERLTPVKAAELAALLKLPADALSALPLVGHCPERPPGPCYTFPETDAGGAVVGLVRRFADGKKRTMPGGKRGLTLPGGWREAAGPVFVVEGPTDALAMTCAGLSAVGRPSARGGSALLAELLRDLPPDRPVLIVGENDRKPDGDWPGRDGAQAVARALDGRLGRPVGWALPPDDAKDVRDWLTAAARGESTWPERGRELAAKLAEATEEVPTPADDPPEDRPGGGKAKGPPAAELLTEIGLAFDLWHDPTQTGHATAGRQSFPVRSKAFRHRLVNEYRCRTEGRVPNSEALSAALNAIEGAAVHDGPERQVYTRVAGTGGRVYLHLGDAEAAVIEIDAAGWRPCPNPPVRFRRPAGMAPLPVPRPGGDLAGLRRFVNVPDDEAFALVLAWLSGVFRPDGPFPVMALLGEQGSAKTTTARVLKRLTDPSAAAVRSEPRDARDLMIQARNGWVLAFDNLSGLPVWLSDALCRLATGGGFSTRELYTNDDEVIFDAKRPLVVNGIEDFVTRADLLERSLLVRHPPITEERRRPESEFWAEFDAVHPALLGALLDRVSAGLRELPTVRLARLPRMADFAIFAAACERGCGDGGRFLDAYADNQAGAHEQALDASPLPAALLAVMEGRESWEGTPAELFAALGRHAPTPAPPGWPKGANALTNRLRRLAPNLRRVHRLHVEDGRQAGGRSGGKRSRFVRITRLPDGGGEGPSPPSPPASGTDPGPRNDAGREGDGQGTEVPSRDTRTVPRDRPPAGPGPAAGSRPVGDAGDGGDGPPRGFSARRFRSNDRPHEFRG